jgi:hypothetical protein
MNDFQLWMISQGYYREHQTHGAWFKNGILVTGKELNEKFSEWKNFS